MQILVVDDNRSSADALARALGKKGHHVDATYDGAAAIEHLDGGSTPDLILTDLRMEPVDGMAVLRHARTQRPPIDVIVFTAYGAVDTAVEAMQLGAHDFLTKPVTLEQILARIDDLADPVLADTQPSDVTFIAMGESSRELLATLRRVADVGSHVWLEGEIGAGRGHAALTVHQLSEAGGPFTTVDPARLEAWPTEGTAFLPNVDDLPLDIQRDLVRLLSHVPDGVRIVATASPDARERVSEGKLLPELYYALAVIVIRVPPLRERREDVLPILRAALVRFAERHGRSIPDVQPSQELALREHSWPGNIRELLNVAERAVVLGGEALDLPVVRRSTPGLPDLGPGFSLSNWLEAMEKRILVEALRRTHGDRSAAGKLLSVERNTLRYKLNKYDLLDK